MKAPKINQATKENPAVEDGQAAGAALAASVADILLYRFSGREVKIESPATKQWSSAWDLLIEALGPMADDVDVRAALKSLDDAYGTSLVESEDRAWHAAWTAATGLRGGTR